MKKLRCTSCGAELKIEDNNEYAICEHCKSRYKLNEDLNINIKLDDNVKEVIDNTLGVSNKFSKFMFIPIIIFFIAVACIITFSVKSQMDFRKSHSEIKEKSENETNDMIEEGKKSLFNLQFSSSAGTESGFFVKSTLDRVIESNKVNDRKVSVIYNDNSTTDENKIIEIKHGLNDRDQFEVYVNYDNGYVNEIKIEKIN